MNPLHPRDLHNQTLAENVRPANWTPPNPDRPYHLVVIGAGTAGLVTAAGAAGLGARVALIERDLMGGDCLNVGCVPSKSLIHSARAVAEVHRAAEFSVQVAGDIQVDFAGVMERMRKLRAKVSVNDSAHRFRDMGVDVFFGQARFEGPDTVLIDDRAIRFRRAVIATGARAAAPPIEGLDRVNYLTNESVFSLTQRPERLGIIGAGPIGTEMAQAFARLGSQVLLVESTHGVLPREDRDAAGVVRQAIERDGVRLLCCGRDLRIRNEGGIRIVLESHGVGYDECVDELLVAAGRAPNVDELNLSAVGVDFDHQGVRVDDHLRTTNPRIFAAGDVCSKYQFTHAADFMARIVIQNALFALGPFGKKKLSDLIIPWATYTSPELAHVGLNEHRASELGVEIDTYVQPLREVDRAILEGHDAGFVKIHTERGGDKILGATIVAEHAGDLISEVTLAMQHGIGLGKIAGTIHPYPTQAEAIRKLGDQYNRTRLTPTNARLLGWLRRWNVGR